MFGEPLSADDAAVLEAFVVPRYLAFFGTLAVDMMVQSPEARVANVGCRTGYPDALLAEKLPGAAVFGVDRSVAAVELARKKAPLFSTIRAAYEVAGPGWPTPLAESAFTHALALHPLGSSEDRARLFGELRRVLLPGGQALVALPLRGSFPEINDMIREYALCQDLGDLGKAVDAAASSRPTIETLSEELERAGFGDADVDVQLVAASFPSGREFLDDPIARLMVFPDTRALLTSGQWNVAETLDGAMAYAHDAIAKYWSEGVFELTVNVGCVSGRRL